MREEGERRERKEERRRSSFLYITHWFWVCGTRGWRKTWCRDAKQWKKQGGRICSGVLPLGVLLWRKIDRASGARVGGSDEEKTEHELKARR